MELKKYQQDVLSDIDLFNKYIDSTPDLRVAFREFWASKGVSLIANDDYLHEYVNTVPGVPRVTVKVPTAGGKTFIACNAIKNILDSFSDQMPKVVVWFVPSDPILQQTYKRLNDPSDPYRQRIDTLFNGRVRVYDKESLLRGNNFNPVIVKEQLSILVLSIHSFASNDKEGRRSKRENENLTEFVPTYTADTHRIADVDETALLQVIASLNPVVIIDESHNFVADLRVETLIDINPRYILELTATPRHNSNIISFVDASRLKKEHMVKLPVIVYNHNKIDDVIMGAINLQRKLEALANDSQTKGGDYIRPIVLFQAQPRNSEDNTTFDKVKNSLIEIGIPENQIKIKTADRDELKGIDLLSPECQVRYIITVDALKEGWDCPFAYILASLANKTSKISVEQILGRILRQPYTRQHPIQFLNLSYVLTCSADFQDTLSSIVKSLNDSGFSAKDYRAVETQETISDDISDDSMDADDENLFSSFSDEAEPENNQQEGSGTEDFDEIDTEALKSQYEYNEVEAQECFTDPFLDKAQSEAIQYNATLSQSAQNDMATDLTDRIKTYPMKEIFKDVASDIVLPQFVIRTKENVICDGDILLTPNHLLEGFRLSTCDKNIEFESTESHTAYIDLETQSQNEYVPKYRNLNDRQLKAFSNLVSSQSPETRVKMLTDQIVGMLHNKFNEIDSKEIRQYVEDVLKTLHEHKLQELANNTLNAKKAFDNKIEALATKYKKERFKTLLDIGTSIKLKGAFSLPERILPKDSPIGLSKSLYKEENHMDEFERRVITKIADLDNVLFWHRNFERGKGFYINGFINHYPDFIVVLKSGHILMIEVKGDHLDGSDSEDKIELGNLWANKAGDRYRYYMVFDHKEVPNAKTLPELLSIIQQME